MRLKSDKNIGHFARRREYVSLLPATWVYHESIFVQTSIFLMVDRDSVTAHIEQTVAFPSQQWLRERATVLHYTYFDLRFCLASVSLR